MLSWVLIRKAHPCGGRAIGKISVGDFRNTALNGGSTLEEEEEEESWKENKH